jgi:hypothetical protein
VVDITQGIWQGVAKTSNYLKIEMQKNIFGPYGMSLAS